MRLLPTFVCVRDVRALSILPAELPSMERTLETLPSNHAADSHVSAKVWTISIQDVSLARGAPENCKVFPCWKKTKDVSKTNRKCKTAKLNLM